MARRDLTEAIEAIDEALNEETGESYKTIKLKKPFDWQGKTYTELHFDFDALTGRDSERIERECAAQGVNVVVAGITPAYNIRVAANACIEPLGVDALYALPLKDYNKVNLAARNFLLV